MKTMYEDEKGANGIWDLAAEIAVAVGLFLKEHPAPNDTPIYAEDYGQEIIYNLLKGRIKL